MPCDICHNLEIKSARPSDIFTSHGIQSEHSIWDSLHRYRQGRAKSCPYCDLVIRVVNHFNPEYDGYAVFQIVRPEGYPYHILLDSKERGGRNGWMVVQMYTPVGKPIANWPSLACVEELPVTLDSDEAYSFIKDNLKTCLDSHPHCRRIGEARTPTRLLKVTGDRIALLEHLQHVQYAALSYSWGGNQELKLTSETKKELLGGIALARLPAVMQDTVEVMKSLGLQYVWIDALCIMQDSAEDWELEAFFMAAYYSNAHITIAASSSSRAAMGFLNSIDREWHSTQFSFNGEQGGTVYARKRNILSLGARAHTGPLADRGWTLQENALSTRFVHFTSSEAIWECRTHHVLQGMHRGSRGLQQQIGTVTLKSSARGWYDMVQAYTSRSLTYVSDKLVAISGMAIALNTKFDFEPVGDDIVYLAGLWRHRLPLDLMWQTKWAWTATSAREAILEGRMADPNLLPWRRPKKLVETFKINWDNPSWSWASTPYTVEYPLLDANEDNLDILVQIQKASCTRPGSNLFGAVSGGQITLQGPCVTAQLRSKNGDGSLRYRIHRDGLEEANVAADTVLVATSQDIQSPGQKVAKSEELDASQVHNIDTRVICLAVCRGEPAPDDWEQLFGLVLAPKTNDENVFTRLGAWVTDDMEWLEQAESRYITII
ncbi:heterokaryon incompatibility protein-domain-containing protein [Lophiotrema nucula]|uniref:Heterokaryon incompatibility protein-domain-containing protein n=1 Tax=Lophiotrema nucula TaxID=690887 RepID=A0A6A5ZTC0_9PLEO|nr:heterokaryon incompatibility protein-domain-containing protein [Lophiotrema nucula]